MKKLFISTILVMLVSTAFATERKTTPACLVDTWGCYKVVVETFDGQQYEKEFDSGRVMFKIGRYTFVHQGKVHKIEKVMIRTADECEYIEFAIPTFSNYYVTFRRAKENPNYYHVRYVPLGAEFSAMFTGFRTK